MKEPLLYRVVPHNGGVVFASKSRAEYVAKIHCAIEAAKTWGELRSLLPLDEYTRITQQITELEGELPLESESFDPDQLPGWSDGDYPPWLQPEMGCQRSA